VVKADGILPLMLLHHKNFPKACAGLAFVTNAGLDTNLSGFIEEIGRSDVETDLTARKTNGINHMC
jgi:hypothetical protein